MSPIRRRHRWPGRVPVPDVARLVLALSLQRLSPVRTKSTHGHNLQLMQMALRPGEEIGEEVQEDRDQFFRIEAGACEVWIGGTFNRVEADDAVIVRQGARHDVARGPAPRKKEGARIVLAPIARRHLAPGSKARQRALASRRAAG